MKTVPARCAARSSSMTTKSRGARSVGGVQHDRSGLPDPVRRCRSSDLRVRVRRRRALITSPGEGPPPLLYNSLVKRQPPASQGRGRLSTSRSLAACHEACATGSLLGTDEVQQRDADRWVVDSSWSSSTRRRSFAAGSDRGCGPNAAPSLPGTVAAVATSSSTGALAALATTTASSSTPSCAESQPPGKRGVPAACPCSSHTQAAHGLPCRRDGYRGCAVPGPVGGGLDPLPAA